MFLIENSAIVLVVDGYPTFKCEQSTFSNMASENTVMGVVRRTNEGFFLTIRLSEVLVNSCIWHVKVVVEPHATDVKIIDSDLNVYTICETGPTQGKLNLPHARYVSALALPLTLEPGRVQQFARDVCVVPISRPADYDCQEPRCQDDDSYLPERYHVVAHEYPSLAAVETRRGVFNGSNSEDHKPHAGNLTCQTVAIATGHTQDNQQKISFIPIWRPLSYNYFLPEQYQVPAFQHQSLPDFVGDKTCRYSDCKNSFAVTRRKYLNFCLVPSTDYDNGAWFAELALPKKADVTVSAVKSVKRKVTESFTAIGKLVELPLFKFFSRTVRPITNVSNSSKFQ